MDTSTFGKFLLAGLFFLLSCTKPDFKNNNPITQNEKIHTAVSGKSISNQVNIILIVGDDIGYEIPTVDGGQSYSTPTLDNMARRGIQFTQCHSSPLCSPSRTSLITGKYNFRNYFTWGSLPQTEKTFANMLADAGYATCVSGKWQFDGGVQSITDFGFQKYAVWDAFKEGNQDDGTSAGSAYKNPQIYENATYLPDSVVQGKYGEDIFCQYVKDFIDSNKNKPFFIYYPMILCHAPFCPTPDDAAFAAWNPNKDKSDTAYFPSMVNYMDEKINEVLTKLSDDGLTNKTLVLFIGDNGTPQAIYSWYNGQLIQGGKSKSTQWGTHVPLFAYGSSKLARGISKNLISFPDFLTTFANVANVPVPTTYGTLDGISFYDELVGEKVVPRTWIYNYYNAHPDEDPAKTLIWSQDTTYKLYNGINHGFYDIITDVYEKSPLPKNQLTKTQKQTESGLQAVIDSLTP